MIYLYPEDNLKDLVQRLPAMVPEQLVYFFRDSVSESKAQAMVDTMIINHEIVMTSETKYYQSHLAPFRKREFLKNFVKAFWVIADFGSNNIRFITEAEYPAQYIFVSPDDTVYDITVLESEEMAALGKRVRDLQRVGDGDDAVNHLAVINDSADIEIYREYGYDFFYTVDMKTGKAVMLDD